MECVKTFRAIFQSKRCVYLHLYNIVSLSLSLLYPFQFGCEPFSSLLMIVVTYESIEQNVINFWRKYEFE